MRQKIAPIDGGKNDIRLIVVEEGWSEDSGLIDGEPIDPPDQSAGWLLVDFWVVYDEEQTTEERDAAGENGSRKKVKVITTRQVRPQLHALWSKPKAEAKKGKGKRPKVKLVADGAVPPAPKGKPRGRGKKEKADTAPAELAANDDVPPEYLASLCPHTRQMLLDIKNGLPITLDDVTTYAARCHRCEMAQAKAEA